MIPINVFFLITLIIGMVSYNILETLPPKCLASSSFVLLGLINLIYAVRCKTSKLKVAVLMMIGIVFAMGGDVSLEINFIVGALVFGIGHVFYLITYCTVEKLRKTDIVFMALLFIGMTVFLLTAPIFDFGDPIMQVLVVIYCAVISFMTAKSITNAFGFNACT